MASVSRIRRTGISAAVAFVLCTLPVAAQSPVESSAARDSLLMCAARRAGAAGFQSTGAARADRILMMRTRPTPGSILVDALRVAVASTDTTRAWAPDVRVTTFVTSRTNGLSREEINPPRSLTALADSIRQECQQNRRGR